MNKPSLVGMQLPEKYPYQRRLVNVFVKHTSSSDGYSNEPIFGGQAMLCRRGWELALILSEILSTLVPWSNQSKSCMRVDKSWLDIITRRVVKTLINSHQNLNQFKVYESRWELAIKHDQGPIFFSVYNREYRDNNMLLIFFVLCLCIMMRSRMLLKIP
jgi:hypothetical protein